MVAAHKSNGYYSINLLNAVYIGFALKFFGVLWLYFPVALCFVMHLNGVQNMVI